MRHMYCRGVCLGVFKARNSLVKFLKSSDAHSPAQYVNSVQFSTIFHYFYFFTPFPGPHTSPEVQFYVIYIYAYSSTIPGPSSTQKPPQSQICLKIAWYWWLISSIGCTATLHPVSHGWIQPPGLRRHMVSLLIYNIFLKDLKSQISA